jgi:hypothetical protein
MQVTDHNGSEKTVLTFSAESDLKVRKTKRMAQVSGDETARDNNMYD